VDAPPQVIDRAVVLADLMGAATHWYGQGRPALEKGTFEVAVDTALATMDGRLEPRATGQARLCLVTKGVHLSGGLPLACVVARLVAFGVTAQAVRRVDGADVARILYPRAIAAFEHRPTIAAVWRRIDRRFDTQAFAAIFGRPYNRALVVPAVEVMRANNLSAAELTQIWDDGRVPVGRAALVRRYGEPAATFVLNGVEQYEWFRGPLPLGISRLSPALMAFAMRHERVNGGDPVIVLNGHVPGLADLFRPNTWVLEVGIDGKAITVADVRRHLVGMDNRPDQCDTGTIRRDAVSGRLPLHRRGGISSRYNLIHCSDGLLAGLIELRGLLPDRASVPDRLTTELRVGGLIQPEIDRIVLADPLIDPEADQPYLSERTAGLALDPCASTILHAVPPVFGPANGYADGVTLDRLEHELRPAATRTTPDQGAITESATPEPDDLETGRRVIAGGGLGVLVPAGGTGGRFGGYHLPESHPARQKMLVRAFTVAGRRVSSLDIRLANVRYWSDSAGNRIPVVVTASPTNADLLYHWRAELDEPLRSSVEIAVQRGIYRVDADRIPGNPWTDAILRHLDGRPSLKSPGHLGVLSGFVISGHLDRWRSEGVEYLAVANCDDVGYRLDPSIVGYLHRNAQVDAVLVAIPWGYSAKVRREDATIAIRGDDSGWSTDEHGRPVADAVPPSERLYDRGGLLVHAGARLSIVETARAAGGLFNTNQIYLRLSALERLLASAGTDDRVHAMQRTLAKLPAIIERKEVQLDDARVTALQMTQQLQAILSLLSRCDVFTATRNVHSGIRSSHATVKSPDDVPFAQLMVDALNAATTGELLLPDNSRLS
jgi:hypothetical protein